MNSISDGGLIFLSEFRISHITILGTELSPYSAENSYPNGQSEIMNRKFEEFIRLFVNFDKKNGMSTQLMRRWPELTC